MGKSRVQNVLHPPPPPRQDRVKLFGWGEGACEGLPLQKGGGGGETVLAMLKGGHKKF